MLSWDEAAHALGMPEMDATHREFAALVAALTAADEREFPALFERLAEHTRAHFDNESRLMRACRFPALAEHEGEHRRVLAELAQFGRGVAEGRLRLARGYVVHGLSDWFRHHLATMDSALAACLHRTTTARPRPAAIG